MGYQVDFIGVGQESKSGDAIAIRWGNLFGPREQQKVVVIDGGFRDSGHDISKHITNYYGTDLVNAVVSTHADQDHINGLDVVLDELRVRELWIHKPWEHNQGLAGRFADGRVTDHSLGERLRENLDAASELVGKAARLNIRIVEPFAGLSLHNNGEFFVLGPTANYYESLILGFNGMPVIRSALHETLKGLAGTVGRTLRQFVSTWGSDDLDDEDTTSAENNSSVITQLTVDDRRLLFVGDAGLTALSHAADQIAWRADGAGLRFVQIPHHGSRRNLGPTILNRLVGGPLPQGQSQGVTAMASTSKRGEPKHPRRAVMNAFTHRGVDAIATRGRTICHSYHTPERADWTPVSLEPYHWKYEDVE